MSNVPSLRTILIIGASRGLGLGLTNEYLKRGWKVIATERSSSANSPLQQLADKAGSALRIEHIDINFPEQIETLAGRLKNEKLDLLFVNAGVSDDPRQTVGEIETEEFVHLMVTNALSPLRVLERLTPLVLPTGCVAVMSSSLGSVAGNTDGGYEAYRASKAALNSLLRSYAVRLGGARSLLALMPGWVKTEMGGPDAPLDVETSVRGLADTIEKHEGQPGLVFADYRNEILPW